MDSGSSDGILRVLMGSRSSDGLWKFRWALEVLMGSRSSDLRVAMAASRIEFEIEKNRKIPVLMGEQPGS